MSAGWWLVLATALRAGEPALDPYEPLCGQRADYAAVAALAGPVWVATGWARPVRLEVAPVVAGAGPVTLARPDTAVERPPGVTVELAVALARLRAGDASEEVTAAVGRLPRAELLGLLSRTPPAPSTARLADALVTALVSVHGYAPDDLRGAEPRLLLHYADWLVRRADERCVGLYQDVLATDGLTSDERFQAVARLAEYHRQAGRPAEAAATWQLLDRYPSRPEQRAGAKLAAARCYRDAGQPTVAERLYREATESGDGWVAGLAVSERAMGLMRAGRVREALAVLAGSISGRYAEHAGIGVAVRRGQCHYLLGEFDAARAEFARALATWQRLGLPPRWEGLESALDDARDCLALMAEWERRPIRVTPDKLLLRAAGGGAASARFRIETPAAWLLRAVASGFPGEVHLGPAAVSELRWVRQATVRATAGEVGPEAAVVLTRLDHPETELRIAVTLAAGGGRSE